MLLKKNEFAGVYRIYADILLKKCIICQFENYQLSIVFYL